MSSLLVRRGGLAAFVALTVGLGGCGDNGTGPNGDPVETTSVTVQDDFFNPDANKVSPGATVTWTWSGTSNDHNVTFALGAIGSSTTQSSGTFQAVMPTAPGVYPYVCTIHESTGMTGAVTVE